MHRYQVASVIATVQALHGLSSHESIARQLGVTAKTVSNWLHGRNYPDDRVIVQLADLAQLDREAFASYIQALRSPTSEGRETWFRAARRLAAAADSAVCEKCKNSNADSDLAPFKRFAFLRIVSIRQFFLISST